MAILRASSGKVLQRLLSAFSDTNQLRRTMSLQCKEVADLCRDRRRMGFEREVARFEEMDHGTGHIAPERLSIARQEKGIVLSPDC